MDDNQSESRTGHGLMSFPRRRVLVNSVGPVLLGWVEHGVELVAGVPEVFVLVADGNIEVGAGGLQSLVPTGLAGSSGWSRELQVLCLNGMITDTVCLS